MEMQDSLNGARGMRSHVELPRLVFFTASTSGACRTAEAWVASVLQQRRTYQKIKLVTVDAQERPDLLERFQIERLPTLVVVDQKVAKARVECPRGTDEIRKLLAPWLR
jgi:thioredoxin-like negative regulator of GroEL